MEAEFVTQLRAQLNASKRYPTGREASMQRPSGRVVVWFVLNRGGQLQDAGIAESSNSILLDNAALTTVRRASFPAWPDAAWTGQVSHRFTATLDFIPQS
ncbi:MAG: energy transducer TonB [Betaproteobacteria bacterium]|nr:energy transducer TonB [Betaproteobacteria bacterium]NBS45639.1 energy transducer TonB [Betaproteobacteria bacterium]